MHRERAFRSGLAGTQRVLFIIGASYTTGMSRASEKIHVKSNESGENRSGYKPAPPKNYVPPAPVKVPPPSRTK